MEASAEPRTGKLFDGLPAKWSLVMAMASFAVYVLGYLAVRFQLTALGVGADLQLVNERYFFEGAKFLIYFVSTLPILVLFGLPLAALGWLALRAMPACRSRMARWWAHPVIPLSAGVVLSLAMIQFVMRRCFAFDNLLLRDSLPGPGWFRGILTAPGDLPGQLYFTLLIASIVVAAGSACAVKSWHAVTPMQHNLAVLLAFLLGIQILLLPVNYGVLMAARSTPRLAPNPETLSLDSGATGWLIWEGATGVTFLVHESPGMRKLVTVPRDKVTRIEIVGYDPLLVLRSPNVEPRLAWTWEKLTEIFVGPAPKVRHHRAAVRGNIFHVSSKGGALHQLTKAGDFHSPLYLPADSSLVALQGDLLVRLDLKEEGEPKQVAKLIGVSRLIGIDPKDANTIFFLADVKGRPHAKKFDLESKQSSLMTPHPVDDKEEELAGCLRSDDRERDKIRVIVKEKDVNSTWTDIFIQQGNDAEINLTRGNGESSRQPALSNDGKYVAFVRVADSS